MSSAPKRKRVTALPARPPWPRLSLVQHRGGTLRSKGGKSRRTELSCCHTCGSPVVARLAQATPASSEEAASGKQEEQRATETEQECHDCATNIPRRVLPHVTSFNDVVDAIRRAQRVLVLCGAGISVSCGLPGACAWRAHHSSPNPSTGKHVTCVRRVGSVLCCAVLCVVVFFKIFGPRTGCTAS